MCQVATANMSLSKQQFVGKLAKKTSLLDKKFKFLDFAKANSTFGCRKLAELFEIGKTAAANIFKEEKATRNQPELIRDKSK